MKYHDLRDFMAQLEKTGELKRVGVEVDTRLEMTEICDRVLRAEGPAILFEKPKGHTIPVLANLFGTPKRVALGMGEESVQALREVGKLLAYLKEPEPPKGLKDAWDKLPILKQVMNMAPKIVSTAPCQDVIWEGKEVDLARLPIQHCWPGDIAPLITWGLVVTKGPHKNRQNLGIYRQQVLGPNKLIMRWLAHRGGALDFREHQLANPGQPFPVAVVLGCDPATILGAVTPVPDSLSEYQFAGLLRGGKTELVKCIGSALQVPASAEIVLEGVIHPDEMALEGPYGDHTGYYNEQANFPVFTVDRITMRKNPIYHSTYTGKPPDEPAILGVARRIHARRDRPDDFIPVACVDVVIDHNDVFGVHELAQERPHPHHHALGVTGVLLLNAHHRHAIRTAFRRQVKIHNLRKLLLQNRHEHFIQCQAQNRRFIRRSPGVSAVVNRVFAVRNALDGKHRKAINFIVIAGMVAVRPFGREIIGVNMPLQHKFRRRRHLQIHPYRLHQLRPRTAQQPRKRIF